MNRFQNLKTFLIENLKRRCRGLESGVSLAKLSLAYIPTHAMPPVARRTGPKTLT